MGPQQDLNPLRKRYKKVDVSPTATLRTESDLLQENDREKVQEQTEDIILVVDRTHHRNYHRYQQPNTTTTISTQETTTQEPQDQPPANQIIALRKRIEKEDTSHSLNLSNLQNQVTTEHARHLTRTKGFRSRLIDLSTAHRENLRISSPNKPQNQHHINGNEVIVANGNKQGYIAKWLEGLKSMSSFSGLRESTSDGMSSVEVVAAKDAKGKGKGIRIVSDGVEEGDGVKGGV
ncbi:hypothetical protein KCU91_g7149, partial [Aureobasidium melanogenum]